MKALPDKQCASDPLPTWLLKKCVGVISPFLCQLFNWSLEHGSVPSSFKCAYITPLLKKADISIRPILSLTGRPRTCLSFPSCLSDLIVSSQLVKYLKDYDLLPDLQSAYRAMHSTETAVLKVLADILLALDSGDLAMLTLLVCRVRQR